MSGIVVPASLAATHAYYNGPAGDAWIAALPELAATFLEHWQLRLDGPSSNGMVALVLPVRRADGTPAVLKLQPVDEETIGEALALRTWAGRGAVRLLDEDATTGTMLLERLDGSRSLSALPDDMHALRILSELLARLAAVPAPAGLRHLSDVAARMLERVPQALSVLPDTGERDLVQRCAAALSEVVPEAGDRLLHWDLHYDNVLAGEREPWLAIDPKPLAGDPGFELLPALHNRWEEVVASGDVGRAVRRRFDLMVDVVGLDRQRARAWTLGRVLQNTLWGTEYGETTMDAVQRAIAEALLA
ncbi:MAG: hydroxyurea phosphotransferase [Actinobacteria bacterium 13_2_20CM_2_71_6]|nr:MAG: hydroxyurea phosphotransferase [Actinobacteria bacterium 13_2_20CM_2_71_6]